MRTSSLVSSALLALVLAGAAGGSFAGSNGTLAYFWAGQVWVMRSDGSGARPLGPGLSPAWSPNGRRLAFDANTSGNYDVWTARADGRDRRRVTQNAALDYSAAWSPDGTSIAFTSDRTRNEDLFVIGADGSGERALTTDPGSDSAAAWSPDGTRIAFAGTARGNLEVEVVNADGMGRAALTDDPARDYDPAWSPDGARIAFTSERDGDPNVYVMNADGTGVTRLTDDPARDSRPAWSPDGKLIAFESSRDPVLFDRDVYVMNADGSNQHRLRSGDVNARDLDWQPTVDLKLTLRRADRRLVATVRNLSPSAAQRVTLRVTAAGRRRVVRVGTLDAGATRTLPVAAQRASVLASAWQIDRNPGDNRASAR
jgi:dipeptidyl aminopeptidase/acylaminoacyl peptidase